MNRLLCAGLFASLVATTLPSAHAAEPIVAVRAGRLLDGVSNTAKVDQVVLIDGARIKTVGPVSDTTIPEGAEVIDLTGATVLPGLIDCHTHLGSRADNFNEINKFKRTPFTIGFAAVVHARKTLDAGFTTVRDLGSRPFLAVDLREAIAEGFLIGPRVVASGPAISMTGGHGDLNKYSPMVRVMMYPEERDFAIADGPDQVRHVVRAQVKYGVDVIKICASGGVMSRGDPPGAPQYSLEELKVAVQEAHALGRKIAAHAHGAIGIKNAVHAGVDSIEHGSMIDDEGIRLMVERSTWLVSDIYNDDYLLGRAREIQLPQESIDKERAIGQLQRDNFARCVRAGVQIAYGTDAGVYPHGDNGRQFALMVRYGMTPAQAIRSATADAAELLGRSDEVGRIAPGLFADIVAVANYPLADVRALEHIGFVMKDGRIHRNELAPRARRRAEDPSAR